MATTQRKTSIKIKAKPISFAKLQEMDLVPATDAAEVLSLHRSGVWRYMQKGVLTAYTHANRLYVSKEELKELKRLRSRTAISADDGKRKPWKQTTRGTLPRNAR